MAKLEEQQTAKNTSYQPITKMQVNRNKDKIRMVNWEKKKEKRNMMTKQDISAQNRSNTRLKVTVKIATVVHISKGLKYLKGPIPNLSL